MKTALKWGFLIGLVNLIWLYAAYYLGLHTRGIVVFQGFMAVWLALTLVGFILALKAVKRENPALSYGAGVAAGTMTAAVSAIVAVVAQVGYFKVIHPAWPEVMIKQARDHFTTLGMAQAEMEKGLEGARAYFTLENYALSSAITALVLGIVLSAIIMIFLRHRPASRP